MAKSLTAVGIQLLCAGMMLAAYAPAQTPAATSSQPASGQAASTQSSSSQSQAGAPAKTQPSAAKKAPAATKPAAAPVVLKTQRDKESYAMGMNLGTGLHNQGLSLDPALVARGMKDAQSGAKTAMTEAEAKAALGQLRQEVQQKIQAKAHEAAAPNYKEGGAFLAANKAKEGIVTLPSGLQYKVLTQGSGPKPTLSDTVTCNYTGTLINGKEFDSSSKHGGPASFPVGRVIKGWTEALQLMPVGSKWQLFIPADLAYGDQGAGADIPPGATLIFEIELLSIGEEKK